MSCFDLKKCDGTVNQIIEPISSKDLFIYFGKIMNITLQEELPILSHNFPYIRPHIILDLHTIQKTSMEKTSIKLVFLVILLLMASG